jgi:cell division protein FtsI/penicillin-binding protein 2
MAKIGQRIGAKRLCEGVKLFGFGKKTGIDLPGEDAGIVHPLPKWNGYSVTRVPFGHEITVTALQITRAYATLANGGRFISPHLFQATVAGTGRASRVKQPPSPAGYIVKPKVAQWIVRQALTAVVTEGTGKKAGIDNVRVFGKTGTANISVSKKIGYDQANYVASFVGGAPAENPSVVILISIRKPNKKLGKGYTGGTVAAPVFREILEKTLTYLQRG